MNEDKKLYECPTDDHISNLIDSDLYRCTKCSKTYSHCISENCNNKYFTENDPDNTKLCTECRPIKNIAPNIFVPKYR